MAREKGCEGLVSERKSCLGKKAPDWKRHPESVKDPRDGRDAWRQKPQPAQGHWSVTPKTGSCEQWYNTT